VHIYADGKVLRKCSGILMDWSKGTGTILTTAQLICSTSPNVDEWLGGDEYALKSEVSFPKYNVFFKRKNYQR
jgi:hypothetical protein